MYNLWSLSVLPLQCFEPNFACFYKTGCRRVDSVTDVVTQVRRLVISDILPSNSHTVHMIVHGGNETIVRVIGCREDDQR